MQNLHICKICVYANLGHVYTAINVAKTKAQIRCAVGNHTSVTAQVYVPLFSYMQKAGFTHDAAHLFY